MARIRVNPEALSQSAVEISSIARNIQKLGEDLWHVSNSAPSYQGQFRSKMRSIGNNALARAKSESAYTNNLSVNLSRKMSAFHSADIARNSEFSKITSIPMIGDPMRLALLVAISAFPFALIQRYLILGQLNFGTLWNPTKVYAAETTNFEDSLESENNSIFGFLGIAWGWITGVVGNIFGKKGDILEDGVSDSRENETEVAKGGDEEDNLNSVIESDGPTEPTWYLNGFGGCTHFVATKRNLYPFELSDNGDVDRSKAINGNAEDWIEDAKNGGWNYGKEPVQGSIIVFQGESADEFYVDRDAGHVAYVEEVSINENGNYRVKISEASTKYDDNGQYVRGVHINENTRYIEIPKEGHEYVDFIYDHPDAK